MKQDLHRSPNAQHRVLYVNLHQMQDENDLENVLSITNTLPTTAAQQKVQSVVFGRYKRERREDVISHWDNCTVVCLSDFHFLIPSPSSSTKYCVTIFQSP